MSFAVLLNVTALCVRAYAKSLSRFVCACICKKTFAYASTQKAVT